MAIRAWPLLPSPFYPISQLVAQLQASSAPTDPTLPSALLIGRLTLGRRPEDSGGARSPPQSSQALFAANPTLQGVNLASLADWSTQGSVSAGTAKANGPTGATLLESTTSQTRFNLQANGADLAASGVTHVTHPDRSRTTWWASRAWPASRTARWLSICHSI